VTDPTTNPALIGLSMGERTGSRVFQWVWSYVTVLGDWVDDIPSTSSEQVPTTGHGCPSRRDSSRGGVM
ncbi:hypothetical protein LZ30DRAFT_602322, partial [Colletotrichum cereale]